MLKLNSALTEPLFDLQRRGCTAIIAGGAVRDSICGRPITDVDVYIWHFNYDHPDGDGRQSSWRGTIPGEDHSGFLHQTFVKSDIYDCEYIDSVLHRTGRRGYERGYTLSPHVLCVDRAHIGGVRYEFIFTKVPPLTYVQTHFDIDLCRAWSDGHKMSVGTPFMRDWHNSTITVSGKINRAEYQYAMANHVPRVQAKYPNYSVVIDPELRNSLTVDTEIVLL